MEQNKDNIEWIRKSLNLPEQDYSDDLRKAKESKPELSRNSEQEVKYRFYFKNAQGVLGSVVLGIKENNNDVAIAAFEELFPNEVWRRFEIVKDEPQPMIPLDQAFRFAKWIYKNGWKYIDSIDRWYIKRDIKNIVMSDSELFELFKQENK